MRDAIGVWFGIDMKLVSSLIILVGAALLALLISGCAQTSTSETSTSSAQSQASTENPTEISAPSSRRPTKKPRTRRKQQLARSQFVRVHSVMDGDTIRLRGGRAVRLVQIDTPEVYGRAECGGKSASNALKSRLSPGTYVQLMRDPVTDSTDKYSRLLRYAILNGQNLNIWMVARGYAAPYFYSGQRGRFANQLELAAQRARATKRGIWGMCPNALLDAYRGIDTGVLTRPSGPVDAAAGAIHTQGARSNLPWAPSGGADLDCSDFTGPVRVTAGDPHRLDRDGDGIGCD